MVKTVLKHLLIAAAITALLVWLVLQSLKWYTKHDEYIVVPDFKNLKIHEIIGNPIYRDYNFFIVDSIPDPEKDKGAVLTQDPYSGSRVKRNRTIYLTIVSFVPEKTVMPDLRSLTLRQAQAILISAGLRSGRISYIPAFDDDAVQQQLYQGKIISPGTRLDKGSYIDLQVGLGSRGEVFVPDTTLTDTTSEL